MANGKMIMATLLGLACSPLGVWVVDGGSSVFAADAPVLSALGTRIDPNRSLVTIYPVTNALEPIKMAPRTATKGAARRSTDMFDDQDDVSPSAATVDAPIIFPAAAFSIPTPLAHSNERQVVNDSIPLPAPVSVPRSREVGQEAVRAEAPVSPPAPVIPPRLRVAQVDQVAPPAGIPVAANITESTIDLPVPAHPGEAIDFALAVEEVPSMPLPPGKPKVKSVPMERHEGTEAKSTPESVKQSAATKSTSAPVKRSPSIADPEAQGITLKEYVNLLAKADEMIRAQRLEENIAQEGVRGAEAIFEPVVSLSTEREGSHVLNTAADALQRGQRPGNVYDSAENRAKLGVSSKVITGATAELSYNLTETTNSLQALANSPSPEYKGYFGFNINQPLLRGAGPGPTRAGIILAKIEQDVAKQTLRQVMMQRLMEGLNSFIAVQRAITQVGLRKEAMEVAEKIELEVSKLNAAGLQPEPEVTKARSSLALRKSQLSEAQEDREEQLKTMRSYVSAAEPARGAKLAANRLLPVGQLEFPDASGVDKEGRVDDEAFLDRVIERRPETRVKSLMIEMSEEKVIQAHDQTLPDLAFQVRAGRDELSANNRPLQYMTSDESYHSWMVGVVFKMGLFGDEKKKSEFKSELLRKEQTELTLSALRQRVANEVNSSRYVLDKALQRLAKQKEIVDAQQNLLQVTEGLVAEGNRSGLDVLKQRLDLLLAREALSDAVAHANRASYLSQQVDGSLLQRLGLE
ncbi:MAG: TolC family protein [Magnetococcales bacterium]|nr:TolC family protein [Magnetococcales bacterium]